MTFTVLDGAQCDLIEIQAEDDSEEECENLFEASHEFITGDKSLVNLKESNAKNLRIYLSAGYNNFSPDIPIPPPKVV